MFKKFFATILGGTKKATEATEIANVETTANVETATSIKNEGETVLFTMEEVKAMTATEAVETLKNQLTEKKADILAKCTTTARIKKELEKAEKKEKETLEEYTTVFMDTTATEKKKATTKVNSNFWHTMKEELATMYTEALEKEAKEKAHTEELKKKATKVLEAVASGEMTMEAATDTMTTEELEALETVATEKKKAEKEKAKKATDTMTEAITLEKLAILATAHRHHEEGTATDTEKVTLAINDVETSKEATMKELEAEEKETSKETKKTEAEAVAEEYTVSKAIKHMKEETEKWQKLLNGRGVQIDVATMTPHTIFGNIHPYLAVPTGKGIKCNLGKGMKALEKWSIENLYTFIWKNDRLHKKALATEVLEAHMKKVEKAEEAMKKVVLAKELLEKAKAEKAEAEKATSTATVEELETATNNVETMEKVVKELETEAKETTTTVATDTMTTEAIIKKAMTMAKAHRTREVKKAEKEGKKELAETMKADTYLMGVFVAKYGQLRGITTEEAMKELEAMKADTMEIATSTTTKALAEELATETVETTEALAKAV